MIKIKPYNVHNSWYLLVPLTIAQTQDLANVTFKLTFETNEKGDLKLVYVKTTKQQEKRR